MFIHYTHAITSRKKTWGLTNAKAEMKSDTEQKVKLK